MLPSSSDVPPGLLTEAHPAAALQLPQPLVVPQLGSPIPMVAPQMFVRYHDPKFPLGRRGTRTVRLLVDHRMVPQLITIPGVASVQGGVDCAWDAVPSVAKMLGGTFPFAQLPPSFTAHPRFYELKLHEKLRPYQAEMAVYLALRAYALNGDPPRSGKTITSAAAAVAAGSRRTLIVCPSIAKPVWSTEILKFIGDSAIVLYGRGADEARLICSACAGSGIQKATGAVCSNCKTHAPKCSKINCACRAFGWAAIYRTPEAIHTALQAARWVIINYDLLVEQTTRDAAGKAAVRADLPGWATTLARIEFDVCIGDEAHLLRGRAALGRRGRTKRDKFIQATTHVPQVWFATGTPIFGRRADLWGLLDALTYGLYGRPFFTFDAYYCGGHKGDGKRTFGWINDGGDERADEELRQRMSFFMLKRQRKDIQKFLPPKTRQVLYVETEKALPRGKGNIAEALRSTCAMKIPAVVDGVMTDMMNGDKTVVFTYLRSNAEEVTKAIAAAMKAKGGEVATRMKAVNARVWSVSGDEAVDVRFKQAQAFREHAGAGVMIATIGSMQVALSLKGAVSVHFADLDYNPTPLLQAEDRPYDEHMRGLAIIYYAVRGSIDEHVIAAVLPRMETQEKVMNEDAAAAFREAFLGKPQDATAIAEEIMARMMANEGQIQA